MPLLNRRKTVLSKIETTSGTDASPTGSANAILCRALDVMPMEGGTVSRDLIRQYFGNSDQLPNAVYGKLSFEIELAGSGAAGTAPAWGGLMRACGFSETVLAAAHTGTAQTGSTSTTIKLAATASATNDAYLGMKIRTTGGTGNGQARTIIDYDGTSKIATVDLAWATTPDATTTYSVDACTAYAPISTGQESATQYFYLENVLHKMLGARGTVNVAMSSDQIPVLKFEFTGVYVPVADGTAPTPTLTAYKQPLVVNKVNTPIISVHGVAAVMQSMSVDAANEVQFRSLPGLTSEQVLLTDRKPKGSISIEATTVAVKDWWAVVRAATLGSIVVEHGTASGNIVRVTTPAAQLTNPKYGDSQGVAMLNMDAAILPVNGNDELLICVL